MLKDFWLEFMPVVMSIMLVVCMACMAILIPVAYMGAPTTQIIARKHGLELTRWEAMWVDQKALLNIDANININTKEK